MVFSDLFAGGSKTFISLLLHVNVTKNVYYLRRHFPKAFESVSFSYVNQFRLMKVTQHQVHLQINITKNKNTSKSKKLIYYS